MVNDILLGEGKYRDSSPRRHDLQEHAEPCSPTQVRRRLPAPPDQDLCELDRGAGLAILGHGNDLEILVFNLLWGRLVPAHTMQQVANLVIAADGRQVPGTVRKHLDEDGQDQGREALEGQKEAPSEVRVAVVDKCQAKGDPVGDGDAQICEEVKNTVLGGYDAG